MDWYFISHQDASREIEVHKSKFCKARDDFVAKEEEFIVLSAVVKQKEVTLTDLEKVRGEAGWNFFNLS